MTTLAERAHQAVKVIGSQPKAVRAIQVRCGIDITQAAISKIVSGAHGDDPGKSIVPILLAVVAGFNVLWMTRGKGPRDVASQLPRQNSAPTLQPFSTVETDDGPMKISDDAILVASAFMALPENKRKDFKRWIETVALEYREAVPDHQLEHLRAPAKEPQPERPMATIPARRSKR